MVDIARNGLALLGASALLLPLTAIDARAPAATAPVRANICGWVHNPTPANWWIDDSLGQWVLGTQGGEQVAGIDVIPDLTMRQWVVTNGSSYGYGCGCMNATVDRKAKRVLEIHSFRQKPLAVCRADRKLRKPNI